MVMNIVNLLMNDNLIVNVVYFFVITDIVKLTLSFTLLRENAVMTIK